MGQLPSSSSAGLVDDQGKSVVTVHGEGSSADEQAARLLELEARLARLEAFPPPVLASSLEPLLLAKGHELSREQAALGASLGDEVVRVASVMQERTWAGADGVASRQAQLAQRIKEMESRVLEESKRMPRTLHYDADLMTYVGDEVDSLQLLVEDANERLQHSVLTLTRFSSMLEELSGTKEHLMLPRE